MPKTCSNNALCSLLTPVQRERMCKYCVHTTIRKGQEITVPMSRKYASLIQSGLFACITSVQHSEVRTVSLYVAGDFLCYFAFAPEDLGPFFPGTVTCIKDASLVQFPLDILRDIFMENPQVAKYMLQASNTQQLRGNTYLYFVLQQNAYDALTYLLDFCKQHNVPRLTYDELAKISNLHRVTVTRTMKEILRSEDFRA